VDATSPSGFNCGKRKEATMSKAYEIHSGRRIVKTVLSSSPLQAAIDHVQSYGSPSKEITILGPDTVSWRGARFRAVAVLEATSG
jgi:hypothetical protein